MKTSTTAIIASVAVLIAVGMFYTGSSLNPKTSDTTQTAFASGTTTNSDPAESAGYFEFNSGKAFIAKGKFIGMGMLGTISQTKAVVPYDDSILETLAVHLDKAPGSGKSWTFTVYVNNAATDLECTISGSSESCTDSHDNIDVAATDSVNVKVSGTEGKNLKKTTAAATVTVQQP